MKRTLTIILLSLSYILSAQEVRDTVVIGDGWRYEGQWPEGRGARYSEKYITVGTFSEGKAFGYGHQYTRAGDVYQGEFLDGKRHGYGKMFYHDGNKSAGMWLWGDKDGPDTLWIHKGPLKIRTRKEGEIDRDAPRTEYDRVPKKLRGCIPVMEDIVLTPDQVACWEKMQADFEYLCRNDHKASFGGEGTKAFSLWVNQRLVYPPQDKYDGVEGRVLMKFTIDKEGNLGDVEVLETTTHAMAAEAVRVVLQSPKWTPAVQYGEKVNMTFTFPVYFMLKSPSRKL